MAQRLPRTSWARAAVLLAVVALGLAACSSGDGGSAQPAATTIEPNATRRCPIRLPIGVCAASR